MHKTNVAFERYFQLELEDVRGMYVDTGLTPKSGEYRKGNLPKFKNKNGAEGGI